MLLGFFDVAAGTANARRCVLADLSRCHVLREFAVDGLVGELAPSRGGWLWAAADLDPISPSNAPLLEISDKGKVTASFDVAAATGAMLKATGLSSPVGTRSGRPLAVGRQVWIVPDAVYELWRPRQHGLPFRAVRPPDCLSRKGQELDGAENVKAVLEKARLFPESARSVIEAAARSGTVAPSFTRATRGLAAFRNLIAVQVTDARVAGGARIDVWDMLTESLVAIVPIPATAGLLAITDEAAWLTEEGALLRQVPFPPLVKPIDEPCRLLSSLAAEAVVPLMGAAPASDRPTP